MRNLINSKNAVDIALEEQRRESEVRTILQDLEHLKTVPVERKRRWVWELIQNAKDCAPKDGPEELRKVNITFIIEKDKLTFAHDGVPFNLKELLALIRRTSTKSYDTEEGNTGKFGTGFVSTHILNKKVQVSGVLKNDLGLREFSIFVDRTPDTLSSLQSELNNVFGIINDFFETPPSNFVIMPLTKYVYELEPDAHQLAIESLDVLKKNLPFTLLINPVINSVVIEDKRNSTTSTFSLSEKEIVFPGIYFTNTRNGVEGDTQLGLFHYTLDDLTIAVPVIKQGGGWLINKIKDQARLYREFPLVGTEHWHIPFFIQSGEFLPSEQRDGVRTFKDNESKDDKTADGNRRVFIKYKDAVITFFQSMYDNKVDNAFLLTESGLPSERTEYTSKAWFTEKIQKPLRSSFLTFPLVKTVSGSNITIDKAKFPYLYIEPDHNEEYYSIAYKYYPDKFPEECCYKDWQRIISQDTLTWGNNILSTPDELVQEICKQDSLSKLLLAGAETKVKWLDHLVGFLYKINRADLGENYSIYPNQAGGLKKKQELCIDLGLNDQIKSIGHRLKQPIYSQLLDQGMSHREGIGVFNSKTFFDTLNTYIGKLVPSIDIKAEYDAVFELVCMFNVSHAREREKWFQLINELMPDMAPQKFVINDMEDFNYDSAELSSIKYICWSIEQKKNFTTFCNSYFQDNTDSAYTWLNNFISVLFRNQKYEELIRKYSVIPMQNGIFRKLEDGVCCEEKGKPFDELFKELYTSYANKGDAKSFLVALGISNDSLPWRSPDVLTKSIDDIFLDVEIEKKVEPDGTLNSLFHKLNEWVGAQEKPKENGEKPQENAATILFPHFSSKRPMLYIKAFGPEVSKMVMAIHKMHKPLDEIEALAKLDMSAADLDKLVKACKKAGGMHVLIEYADLLEQEAKEALWRKNVGTAAEQAFFEAISELEFFDIENPDRGFDFEIIHPSSGNNYLVEIKSTVQFKESIQMSSTQGVKARDNSQKYALCVVSRVNADDDVTKDYFIERAKFLTNVGTVVSDKVYGIENGLTTIRSYKNGEEASSALDNEKYSVFVGKKAWSNGISFYEFVSHLKKYFNL